MRAMAGPRPGPGGASRRRQRHQQRVGRAARRHRRTPVPADRGRRGGRGPIVADRRAAADRPAQGRPSRQSDGHDRCLPRRGPASGRGGLGRGGQSVWPSGAADPAAPRLLRRAGVPDGCRRVGLGDVRSGGPRRPDGPATGGGRVADRGRRAAAGRGGRDRRGAAARLLLCDPRDQGPVGAWDRPGRAHRPGRIHLVAPYRLTSGATGTRNAPRARSSGPTRLPSVR